ncbi:MAG TPA: hypothetical protein HPP94_12965 [Desulfuromonadales bacterium]|nr:hypothetical protein [Desulfuromonadales bacterium]
MKSNPDIAEITSGRNPLVMRSFSAGMLIFTLIVTGIYLSRPLFDPDFYWHLKTGQWIWQNMSLPQMDPFGVPPLAEPSPRTAFILTSYWLVQLIMYALYSCFGMSGIILFRWIIAGILLAICTRWTNLRNSTVTAVLAIGTIQLLEFYFIERPQFISFVCFGTLLVILFRFFEQGDDATLWKTLIPLSLLMLIWSNMHGGFLIGQAILVYFCVAEGLKFCHRSLSPLSVRSYRILLLSALAALIASFINPNALNLLGYLPTIFDADNYANLDNLEEMSVFHYFIATRDYAVFLNVLSIALTSAALAMSQQRTNITWIGIIIGTAGMGCLHMRLMPFFLVAAMIFMAKCVETKVPAPTTKMVIFSLLIVTSLVCLRDEFPRIVGVIKTGWVPGNHYPVKAADFVAADNSGGNMYTTMNWGGYLIWRAGPQKKIFFDSRYINLQRAWEYNNSTIIGANQRPYWKGLFAAYDVRIALLPLYEDDGSPNQLTQSMYADPEWAMVFSAENEVVLVRKR